MISRLHAAGAAGPGAGCALQAPQMRGWPAFQAAQSASGQRQRAVAAAAALKADAAASRASVRRQAALSEPLGPAGTRVASPPPPPPQQQQPLRPRSPRAPTQSSVDDDLVHERCFYDWKWGSRVRYLRAGASGPPLLLAHGFGTSADHFEHNIAELAKTHRVYAVDLLGQGHSWPTQPDCEHSGPLRYSADTWREQLFHFIQEKIGEPVYVAGNSLGGFLGVSLAAHHPEAVRGLVLLNAAPFWSFWCSSPPVGRGRLLPKSLQLDGTVPAPQAVSSAIRVWWNLVRRPEAIRSVLQLVYARPHTLDDQLVERIVEATRQPGAFEAFTSIVLSPRTDLTFDEMLSRVRCPVCLAYGRDDPWVVPLMGHRVKRRLPHAQYLQLAPAGHCPHHEAPRTVNGIIAAWVSAVEAGEHEEHDMLQVGNTLSFEEEDGQVVQVSILGRQPDPAFDHLESIAWRLRSIGKAARQAAARAASALRG